MACNISHVDEKTIMAPDAGLDDGVLSLVFTNLTPSVWARFDLLDGLLKTETGTRGGAERNRARRLWLCHHVLSGRTTPVLRRC